MRGDLEIAARRHAIAYMRFAELMEVEFDFAPESAWIEQADIELDNCRAALYWTLDARGDIIVGQRLAGAMGPMWGSLSSAGRMRRPSLSSGRWDPSTSDSAKPRVSQHFSL
jgi:hypothetical protein